jgi:hypothetical protein
MKSRVAFLLSVVALALLIGAGPARAQASGDSVVGNGSAEDKFLATHQIGCCQYAFTLDAHSGPRGENPSGSVTVHFTGRDLLPYSFSGHVSCLAVNHTRSVIGVIVDQVEGTPLPGFPFPVVGQGATLFATDTHGPVSGTLFDGAPPDADRFGVDLSRSGCPAFPTPPASDDLYYVFNGDIAIHDAEPPNTYAQCRHAGWVPYGYASRAECIDGVQEFARQKCIFEQAAIGITNFEAKYGLGPNHRHALRHCIRLYTGF